MAPHPANSALPARRLASLSMTGALVAALAFGATPVAAAADEGTGTVTVTTEVLGSVVGQLVGDAGEVIVIMPGGANPHSYEPSARDAESVLNADVVVSNGLDLEESLLGVLAAAESEGVTWFEAADHITPRDLEAQAGAGDHAEEAHDDDGAAHGAEDPHFWTDPTAMRDVVLALAPVLAEAGFEVADNAAVLTSELEALDVEVAEILSAVPVAERKLVTGHRSMGYFAERYDFEQIGTVIPGLSTSGEPTARELAQLIADIKEHDVAAVFAEVGTPRSVVEAVAGDSGAELVELSTSQLPEGGDYQDLIREMATTIAGALAG